VEVRCSTAGVGAKKLAQRIVATNRGTEEEENYIGQRCPS